MSPRRPLVLIVDDEPQIRRFLRTSLPPQGFEICEAATAAEALESLARDRPDAIILDLGLPDRDGLDLIADIRRRGLTPILVLSARDDVSGKVAALEKGADDYVTKPFDMTEFLARLQTALRHGLQAQGEAPVFQSGALRVDLVHRRITLDGNEVKLTPKEYDVLRHLVRHAGKVITHQQLLREVWGPAHAEDVQYLRVLMRQLRTKLEPQPSSPSLLLTEPGVGYRLSAN
jgi:two-component system KDP operon response regulator KdpE